VVILRGLKRKAVRNLQFQAVKVGRYDYTSQATNENCLPFLNLNLIDKILL
jgi:hypothetical protein